MEGFIMANKNKWEVAEIPLNVLNGKNEFAYQLYRIKDKAMLDHTGNREWGEVFKTQKEAEQEAAKRNKKYFTHIETEKRNVTPREFWEHCNKILHEYNTDMDNISPGFKLWENPDENEISFKNENEWHFAEPYDYHDGIKDEETYIIKFTFNNFDDEKKGNGYFYATDFDIRTTALIKNEDYSKAYKEYKKIGDEQELNFLKKVVKTRGIELDRGGDVKNIKDAVIAVCEIENNLSERELFSKLIKTDEFNDAYKSFYIKNKDFVSACERNPSFKYPEVYADVDNGMNGVELHSLEFMKEVVKAHGTDTQTINDAVNAITEYKQESPRFMAKLLQCTLQTNEYRQSFDAVQGKSQENTR